MARPVMILILYLVWANGLWLHGWLGLFGSECLNAHAFLLELFARLEGETPIRPPFFCREKELGENAFWLGVLFFSFLPGFLAMVSLWLWDRFHGRRHIDLTV